MDIAPKPIRAAMWHGCLLLGLLCITGSAVAAPVLSINNTTLTQVAGNGDSVVDPGEDWNLTIQLGNTGDQTASAISATLASGNASVVVTQATSAYPDIAAGGNANNSTAFSF